MPASDPCDLFASERALLAWLRTGIAIVGLRFVVSRCRLFLPLVAAQAPGRPTWAEALPSAVLGAAFDAVGAVALAAAAMQHCCSRCHER